jgi:hypothetical protein
VPQHLRRAALVLAAAASVSAVTAGTAFADTSAYCVSLPATYMSGGPQPTTNEVDLCIPWPGKPL